MKFIGTFFALGFCSALGLALSTYAAERTVPAANGTVAADAAPALMRPEIIWDSSHPILVQKNAHYGRIVRLKADTIVAGFEWRRGIYISLSTNEGLSWGPPILVAENSQGTCTNTELIVLKNGELLCFFNFRPDQGRGLPFSLSFSRSRDGGASWLASTILYTAGEKFGDGCWEPAAIQLSSGEIQVYFANESPYRTSNEQEISMLRSHDHGAHWTQAETASFRRGGRDGMPAPVISNDGKTIFVAIEDNGVNGRFKPVIISRKSDKRDGPITGDSASRWTAHATPLLGKTYAGAPCLRQLADNNFLLSYQVADSGKLADSRMAVSVGNDHARDFDEPTFPFPESSGHPQLWNALFIKDDHSVIAISETTMKGIHGIWMVKGILQKKSQ